MLLLPFLVAAQSSRARAGGATSAASTHLFKRAVAPPSATTRIHIGSCSDTHEPQPLWSVLEKRNADAFFWGGDVVYGDRDPAVLKKRPAWYRNAQELFAAAKPTAANASVLDALYRAQAKNEAYRRYASSVKVLDGIYDDHDFGVDNSHGRTFDRATKDAHKNALLDFLHVPSDDARRRRGRGVWAARRVGDVDVVLLDGRYHRGRTAAEGLLGEAQFRWLEGHLRASAAWARATVVVSPVQVLATKERPSPAEGFFEFPDDRARLLNLLANRSALIVSGDVHYAELSAYACAGGRTVPEMTTSGLSHSWGSRLPAHYDGPLIHRAKHFAMAVHQRVLQGRVWRYKYPGEHYLGLNAGEVDVTAEAVTARVLDHRGRVRLERRWTLDELRGDGDGACEPHRGVATRLDVLIGFSAVFIVLLCPLALVALVAAALLRRIRRPPAMVRTLSSLEKGKHRNYVVSASKEACLLAEYRLGPLQ